MRNKSTLLLLAITLAFSCKNESVAPPSRPADASVADAELGRVAGMRVGGAPPAAAQSPALPRMVIRAAQMSIVVGDAAAVADKLTALAASAGGYVAEGRQWRDNGQLRATITLRVPAQQLNQTIAAARKLASRVDSENVDSNDVTQEYVDLDSQVRNLEAAEVEMRQLMTTVRQRMEKAQDILEVYQHLTELRGQIEQAKGRMRYLSQMAALSTLKVDLIPDAIARPVVEPGWQPVAIVRNAGRSLVATLQVIADAVIWVVIYLLPIALLFILAALAVRATVRAIRRRPSA